MAYLYVIKHNIDQIESSNEIDCIRTGRIGRGLCLIAHFSNGKELQISSKQTVMTYPFEPFNELSNYLGNSFMYDFETIGLGRVAINKENIVNFDYRTQENGKVTDIYASFKSGNVVRLYGVKNKYLCNEKLNLMEKFDLDNQYELN